MRPTEGMGYRGIWPHGQQGHSGYGVQGVWATSAIHHMGNGAHGQWGSWAPWAMGPMGQFEHFLPITSLILDGFLQKFY